jgi:hypothetical protein
MRPNYCWLLRNRAVFVALALAFVGAAGIGAEEEPAAPIEVVDFSLLLPVLPEAPSGWTADKPDGSTMDVGGFKLTNVHRDYRKGEGNDAPTAAISILDSAANPDYVSATTAAWNFSAETVEGYTKSITIDDLPGFETFEKEGKKGTLWVMVGKRYFLEIETKNQDAKELREWLKRIDLKKLAEIK